MFNLRLGSVRSLTSRLCHNQRQQARASSVKAPLGLQHRALRCDFDSPKSVLGNFGSSSTVSRSSSSIPSSSASIESDTMAEELKSNKMYGGFNKRFKHKSSACGCDMIFTVFFPPAAELEKVPVIYYLSGLTCTDENVIQKSGIQKKAAELGVAIVAPDTSPRGHDVEGEADSYDFGVGAGFYLNATEKKWKNWRMYEYITEELPAVLAKMPSLDTSKAGIMGHSMGGHGALTIFLKNPTKYKSLSAFSPICNPITVPWGEKALSGYLGDNKEAWKEYDATELLKNYSGPFVPTLIDIGTKDDFMYQLSPHTFASVAMEKAMPVVMRMQEGYDHSYFFIQTFVDDHIEHHAKLLKA